MARTLRITSIAVAGIVVLAACSSGSSAKPHSVNVSEKEFALSISSSTVAAGSVSITVDNKGNVAHELVVFRTDLDEKSLPITADGHKIDEKGAGIAHLDPEAEDVAQGTSKTITIDLPPGRYVFVCNVEDHYTQGMHAVVTTS